MKRKKNESNDKYNYKMIVMRNRVKEIIPHISLFTKVIIISNKSAGNQSSKNYPNLGHLLSGILF